MYLKRECFDLLRLKQCEHKNSMSWCVKTITICPQKENVLMSEDYYNVSTKRECVKLNTMYPQKENVLMC